MAKKDQPKYFTPKGIAKFPHLTTPQTEINGKTLKAPIYAVSLLLDPNDAETIALKNKIQQAHEEGFAAAKKANPKKKYTDMGIGNIFSEDTTKDGEPTGKLAVKFKAQASGLRKDKTVWNFRLPLCDAKTQPLPAGTMIYGGSVIRVNYSINHAAMETGSFYTSLKLNAVQGIVVKSTYERDFAEYGFKDEEEGQNAFGEQQAEGGADEAASGADF